MNSTGACRRTHSTFYRSFDGRRHVHVICCHLPRVHGTFDYVRLREANIKVKIYSSTLKSHSSFDTHLQPLNFLRDSFRSVETVVRRTRDSVDDLFTIQAKLSSGKQIEYAKDDALNRLVEGDLCHLAI